MELSEKRKNLQQIRDALANLWSDVPERKGQFFLPPHPKPDFHSVDECLGHVKWMEIEPEHQVRVENIREAILAMRDHVKFSEHAIAFDPLKGGGFMYNANTGMLTVTRYKDARKVIDIIGAECHRLLLHLQDTANA